MQTASSKMQEEAKKKRNPAEQVIRPRASSSFEEKSGALKGQRGENLISVPLHFSLSFQSHPSSSPPFLIFLGTEVPACLAHDIDFHQCLEITSEPLPGQPASTFLHFLHTAAEFFSSSLRFFFFFITLAQLTERRDDKCSQVERRRLGIGGALGGGCGVVGG